MEHHLGWRRLSHGLLLWLSLVAARSRHIRACMKLTIGVVPEAPIRFFTQLFDCCCEILRQFVPDTTYCIPEKLLRPQLVCCSVRELCTSSVCVFFSFLLSNFHSVLIRLSPVCTVFKLDFFSLLI